MTGPGQKHRPRRAGGVSMLSCRGHFCPQGTSVRVVLGWRGAWGSGSLHPSQALVACIALRKPLTNGRRGVPASRAPITVHPVSSW